MSEYTGEVRVINGKKIWVKRMKNTTWLRDRRSRVPKEQLDSSGSEEDTKDSEYRPPGDEPLVTKPQGVLESAQISEKEEKNHLFDLSDNELSPITDQWDDPKDEPQKQEEQQVQQQPNQEEEPQVEQEADQEAETQVDQQVEQEADQFAMSPIDELKADQPPNQVQQQVEQEAEPQVDQQVDQQPVQVQQQAAPANIQRTEFKCCKKDGQKCIIAKRRINIDRIAYYIKDDPLHCKLNLLLDALNCWQSYQPHDDFCKDLQLLIQFRRTQMVYRPFTQEEIRAMAEFREDFGPGNYYMMSKQTNHTPLECRIFWMRHRGIKLEIEDEE